MTRDNFQVAGEECESCKPFWTDQGLEPMQLITLPSVTQRYHSEVAVCEYCDGSPIVQIANKNHVEPA